MGKGEHFHYDQLSFFQWKREISYINVCLLYVLRQIIADIVKDMFDANICATEAALANRSLIA